MVKEEVLYCQPSKWLNLGNMRKSTSVPEEWMPSGSAGCGHQICKSGYTSAFFRTGLGTHEGLGTLILPILFHYPPFSSVPLYLLPVCHWELRRGEENFLRLIRDKKQRREDFVRARS